MRYLIIFTYDGSNFGGYQKQARTKTIQGELEKALKVINTKAVSVYASGRTDAKVHALNQTAHFDLTIDIKPSNLKKALNSLLPNSIHIKELTFTKADFHARFDTSGKEYMYKINVGEYNPLEVNYAFQYNKPLDLVELERGLKYFEGIHNFKSFTKSNPEIKDYERNIFDTKLEKDRDYILIYFKGSGFMRYMVRNMVGTLVEIGSGKRRSDEVIEIISQEDRTKAGKTANPEGLYLMKVFYDKGEENKINENDQ